MLVVFSLIFLADTKIISQYDFVAPLLPAVEPTPKIKNSFLRFKLLTIINPKQSHYQNSTHLFH